MVFAGIPPKIRISQNPCLPIILPQISQFNELYVTLLRKSTKTPGTRKFQSTSFLFKSRKRHLSVKEVLPLELPACFLGAAGLLQLATRQSERLTSSQTGLALFPKNNQVQVVEFNGAGYNGNYRC